MSDLRLKKAIMLPADDEVFCGEEMKPFVALTASGEVFQIENQPANLSSTPNRESEGAPLPYKMEMPLLSWAWNRIRRFLGHSG